MEQEARYYATGKRKNAVARVWLKPGTGQIQINDQPAQAYLQRESLLLQMLEPLRVLQVQDRFDVVAIVRGGGKSGQAFAIRHGIARALQGVDQAYRRPLKDQGLLTRDARIKERKKYGRRGARKRPQYSKR